jgi:hypothetical protein
VSADLYVEGGGDHNEALTTRCRKAFAEFFLKAGVPRGTVSIIPCGGRRQTYDDFKIAVANRGKRHPMLLVDSEAPVADPADPWKHVADREGDKWPRPHGAKNDQIHFMAQAMEAWFYADKEGLAKYYDQHFKSSALSLRTNVEEIPKADLFDRLKRATKDCQKGEYSKGQHSFKVLAQIDPSKVRSASPHAERLLTTLAAIE